MIIKVIDIKEGEMMCEYCNRRIHAPGCPNALDECDGQVCDYCKDGIDYGDEYLIAFDSLFHKSCFLDYICSLGEDDVIDLLELTIDIKNEE